MEAMQSIIIGVGYRKYMTLGAVVISVASWSYSREYNLLLGPYDSNLKSYIKFIVCISLGSPYMQRGGGICYSSFLIFVFRIFFNKVPLKGPMLRSVIIFYIYKSYYY